MRIGALQNATGVSRRLLRYYEEQGLLRPARTTNGYRRYSESDIAAVQRIRFLLAAGLPTAVIARVMDCVHDDDGRMTSSGCAVMTANLRRERDRITEEIERLQASRRAIETLLPAPPEAPGVSGGSPPETAGTPPGDREHGL